MTIHCIDTDPNSGSRGGAYEDTSLVERYVMSDEEYNKRTGTLRDWGRQRKKDDPNFSLAKHAKQHGELMEAQRQAKMGLELPKDFEFDNDGNVVRKDEEVDLATERVALSKTDVESNYGAESVEGIEVGMRCQVSPGTRRGSIAYVGKITELGGGGHWVGVIFDEPVGNGNDGMVNKKRYFQAPGPKYGGFIRGKHVMVGDFPEQDIMDEFEDESEDEL